MGLKSTYMVPTWLEGELCSHVGSKLSWSLTKINPGMTFLKVFMQAM